MPISLRSSNAASPTVAALVEATDPDRNEVERFIADVYFARYGASLSSFLPHLLAFRHSTGQLRAAVGLRSGMEGPLFVEQYLDQPAESAIAFSTGRPVQRRDIVEAGNFGALYAGDARELIINMTHCLHLAGFRWVLFAATRQLRNTFDRLHLATVPLAPALAHRLRNPSTDWGSYYDTQPTLMFGDIAAGHAFLAQSGALPEQVATGFDGSCLDFAGASA